ncbi:hypothetical protein ACIGO8_01060 [Streptomyces sp. NPDC053493]|uniref:hypothetical protein n=1 Tax=Streptomyces sp. NPDC053493 TaxID=3365705 RepID=UPI0037D438BC
MFDYQIHQARHTELVREAAARRLAHEAARVARARRADRRQDPEGRVNADRQRFVRAA